MNNRVIYGWDGESPCQVYADTEGALLTRNSVYSPADLAWVSMTQPGSIPSDATLKFTDYASDTTYEYFGFQDGSGGAWQIKRLTTATTTMRYASGGSNYATAWGNRAEPEQYGY